MHILLGLISPGSAKTDIGWGKKNKPPFNGKLCRKYSHQKLWESNNFCSSWNRKCPRCFFRHSVHRVQATLDEY